jgi:hypothetical protein
MNRRDRYLHAPVVWEPSSRRGTDMPDEAASVWALFLTLGVLKLVLVLAVVAMYPTTEAVLVQVVTSWPWLVVPAVFLATPAVLWYRRLRVRAKRRRLLEAEWREE